MILLAVIIGLAILFLTIQCIQWNSEGEADSFSIVCGCVLGIMLVFEVILINESISEFSPIAMDIYQGKTTLEYTIRDGVKVDSVVMWKEDIDNED